MGIQENIKMQLVSADIYEELNKVSEEMYAVLSSSDNALLNEVGDYVHASPGKKIRPMIVLLTGKALGKFNSHHVKIAAALELTHLATLLHDDVIDKALVRHNRFTVGKKWGTDLSILLGDYVFTNAFRLALSTGRPELLDLFCSVTSEMCEGEITQVALKDKTLSQEEYLSITIKKTARLFSACGTMGAIIAEADKETVEAFTQFGLDLGIGFQITDDALDFVANPRWWGKDLGNDLREGRLTLPLIWALHNASDEDRRSMFTYLNDGRDFNAVLALINQYDGIEYALGVAKNYIDNAIEKLKTVPISNSYIDDLETLSQFVLSRVR